MRKMRILLISIVLVAIVLNGCKKDNTTKKDPVITWANPADISYGTLLSATQLNAKANVPGTFVYTPEIGTKLFEGANQVLNADFTPTDVATYNAVSKTVTINVTKADDVIFNPNLTYGTMTDQDGNVYKTIVIGTQTWMAENLRTTKYRNGSAIPEITDNSVWYNLTTGAYCWYNNSINNKKPYGALYNWFTVGDPRNIAPAGWHVPTDEDWTILTTYLGGVTIAGGKMKEVGLTHWQSPNAYATNESGFTALPVGYRYFNGSFYFLDGGFWSSTQYNSYSVWLYSLSYLHAFCVRSSNYSMQYGFSVRCVKD